MNGKHMFFLIPPSEWKKIWWTLSQERHYFEYEKPTNIAENATQKDLKCTWKRYEEGISLNKTIDQGPWMSAIERYTGVMFKAMNYEWLDKAATQFFDETVLILSWLYWWVRPQDHIANYKLPVDTKWLGQWRWAQLNDTLLQLDWLFIDLLPGAHKKFLNFDLLENVVHVDFFVDWKKMTHWVKWVKWQWIHDRCLQGSSVVSDWPLTMSYKDKEITILYS